MSPFEFFFSFYGLLLALSVATVAMGLVKALKLHGPRAIGWLTPLLALFVLFDISSFWAWAWEGLREAPFSYGLMILGMVIALIYFVAASFIFPEDNEAWTSLDDYYNRRKRVVYLGVMASNVISYLATLAITHADPFSPRYITTNGFAGFLVISLAVNCVVRNRWVNALMLLLNIGLYLYVATVSFRLPGVGG